MAASSEADFFRRSFTISGTASRISRNGYAVFSFSTIGWSHGVNTGVFSRGAFPVKVLHANIVMRQEQHLLGGRQQQHRSGLGPAGEVIKIWLWADAENLIASLGLPKQHQHAVERFAQAGAPQGKLIKRNFRRGRQRERRQQQHYGQKSSHFLKYSCGRRNTTNTG